MTTNQIQYLSVMENVRHNTEVESETARHNVSGEKLQGRSIDETIRSNLANESIRQAALEEERRHNKASEAIQATKVATDSVNGFLKAILPG